MTQPAPAAARCPSRLASTDGPTAGAVVACRQRGQHTIHSNLAAEPDQVAWVTDDDNEIRLPCGWCRKPGATHTEDEHPLPRDHADYDAFFDGTDTELSGMASEAIQNFGARP